MITNKQLYCYLEEMASKKRKNHTAREIADHFNIILPHAIAMLEFGVSKGIIMRYEADCYTLRKRSKISEDIFVKYINTKTSEIIKNQEYNNSFKNYLKRKNKNRNLIYKNRVSENNTEFKNFSQEPYDKLTKTQVGFIFETGHGRKKTKEWNDDIAKFFRKQIKKLNKKHSTYEKP